MTEQEAINILYDGTFHITKLGHSSMILFDEEFNEARNMAVAALEKQIPKKPNKAIDKSWGIKKEAYVCPVCDYFLPKIHFIPIEDMGYSAGKKTSYCETCGQKIDWNEVEE